MLFLYLSFLELGLPGHDYEHEYPFRFFVLIVAASISFLRRCPGALSRDPFMVIGYTLDVERSSYCQKLRDQDASSP